MSSNRMVSTTIYITPEQDAGLREVSRKTMVPMSRLIRIGINKVIEAALDHLKENGTAIDQIQRLTSTHALKEIKGWNSNAGATVKELDV